MPQTGLKVRARVQHHVLGEAQVDDAVGEGEDGIVASDRMIQHRFPKAAETPLRQGLPMPLLLHKP